MGAAYPAYREADVVLRDRRRADLPDHPTGRHRSDPLDLNPVIAGPRGAVAVYARVRIAAASPPRPWPKTWR